MNEINLKKIDWISIISFGLLLALGLGNIFSSTQAYNLESIFSFNPFTKQLIFVLISVFIFLFIQLLPFNFFIKYSSLLYVFSVIALLGLFIFGTEINGAKAWYQLGGFSVQPSEFAKPLTALALAKYLSDLNSNLKKVKTQFYSFLIVLIPVFLITIQPDLGTSIIFLSFILVFYKVGLPSIYMNLFVGFIFLFLITIILSPTYVVSFLIISMFFILFFKRKKKILKKLWLMLLFSQFLFFQ